MILLQRVPDDAAEWRYGQATVGTRSYVEDYSLIFEALVTASQSSSASPSLAGVDDVLIKMDECAPTSIHCDFEEHSTCAWRNHALNSRIDWVPSTGRTRFFDSSPEVDVTLGTGAGVYLAASWLTPTRASEASESLLVSDYLRPTSGCFSMWYFMHGEASVRAANLSVYMNNSVSGMRLLVSYTGEQGDEWHQLHVDAVSNVDYWTFVLAARNQDGVRSELAIDNVEWLSGEWCAFAGKTTPSVETTTVAHRHTSLDCDFEVNIQIENQCKSI